VANVTKEGTNKDMEIDKRPMDYLYTSFLQPFPKLILKKMNCNEIEEIIRLMKPNAAHGYDGITANLINPCLQEKELQKPQFFNCNIVISSKTVSFFDSTKGLIQRLTSVIKTFSISLIL
jgi:hypothetical protein